MTIDKKRVDACSANYWKSLRRQILFMCWPLFTIFGQIVMHVQIDPSCAPPSSSPRKCHFILDIFIPASGCIAKTAALFLLVLHIFMPYVLPLSLTQVISQSPNGCWLSTHSFVVPIPIFGQSLIETAFTRPHQLPLRLTRRR